MTESNMMDLHMHSCYSDDGEYSPTELMTMCKEAGLKTVAISDHNCTDGLLEAQHACETLHLQFIPAVELDCTIGEVELHVLGYGIDATDPALQRIHKSLLQQEQRLAKQRLQKAQDLGLIIDEEKALALAHDGCITGEIIAEVALQDHRNDKLMKEYLPNGSRSDNPYVNFYWDYCSKGKPAYVKTEYITIQEAVEVITQAGGFAILAHPGQNTKEDRNLLDAIFSYDIKGLEAFSSYHTKEQIAFYVEYAKAHQLLMTAGSDFHGKTKPSISLGQSHCDQTETLYRALQPFLKQ